MGKIYCGNSARQTLWVLGVLDFVFATLMGIMFSVGFVYSVMILSGFPLSPKSVEIFDRLNHTELNYGEVMLTSFLSSDFFYDAVICGVGIIVYCFEIYSFLLIRAAINQMNIHKLMSWFHIRAALAVLLVLLTISWILKGDKIFEHPIVYMGAFGTVFRIHEFLIAKDYLQDFPKIV